MNPTGFVILAIGLCLLGLAVVATWRRRRAMKEALRAFESMSEAGAVRPVQGHFFGLFGRFISRFNDLVGEHSRQLRSLEDDRATFAGVLDGMDEGVIAVDGRRRLLFANDTACRLLGFGHEERGRLFVEVVRHPQLQQVLEAASVTEHALSEEITVAAGRRAGSPQLELVLSVNARPVNRSPLGGVVLVLHDVTELRRLERMRQDFVANVSHEFKTPLASIKAYTETLLDGALHDPAVNIEFLSRIEDQAERLHQLVLDMLTLSRIERGQSAFRHAPIAVVPVVRSVFEAHQVHAAGKQQQLLFRPGNVDESVIVCVDAEALRQILNNLLENAIKYTPSGGRISLNCRDREGHVEFEVSDTGIGIARDELSRVFERFYRVDRARSHDVPGTGLGLAIVKHLVGSLGGRVSVRSRLNAGSTFTVVLPKLSRVLQEGGSSPTVLMANG